MATVGPLLRQVLQHIDSTPNSERTAVLSALEAKLGIKDGNRLPALIHCKQCSPRKGETFEEYRYRVTAALQPIDDALAGGQANQLILSNGIASAFRIDQFSAMADLESIDSIELDPLCTATQMDETCTEVGVQELRLANPTLRGDGVRVAVLDTGVDIAHPFLQVAESISTCNEDVSIPGIHGTHCAGALAGRDATFAGIAPDVSLLNVKVLKHNNRGTPTNIARGIDAAVQMNADIISISLGFNHLPTWSDRGHGWSCGNGDCVMCTAVDNAAIFGAIVVAAAGNEHNRAEALRRFGASDSFDTELTCPGHARRAIAVGALSKAPNVPAEFSSRGPTAYGFSKPVFCCPGVNITSTVPAPRTADGNIAPTPVREDLFAADSGTSMATPVVAGAIALVIQDRREKGLDTSRDAVLDAVQNGAVVSLGWPENVVGLGRIDLSSYA